MSLIANTPPVTEKPPQNTPELDTSIGVPYETPSSWNGLHTDAEINGINPDEQKEDE